MTPPPEIGDISILKKVTSLSEMRETNTEITYIDHNREYPIQSYQELKEEFKEQIEYDILKGI